MDGNDKNESRSLELAELVTGWMEEDGDDQSMTGIEMMAGLLTVLSNQAATLALIGNLNREAFLKGVGRAYDLSAPVVAEAIEEIELEDSSFG